MRYQVLLERKALKQFEKLSLGVRSRVLEALRVLEDEGFSKRLDIVKLRGYENQYRIRIGRYRVLFETGPEKTFLVHSILPRKAAY